MAKLTNKVIEILTEKVLDSVKKSRLELLNSSEFKAKKSALAKEYDIKKLCRLIDLRDHQLSELQTTNLEIKKLTSRFTGFYCSTPRKSDIENKLDEILLSEIKQVSSKDVETAIILSNDQDLAKLLENLIDKFSVK